MPNFKDFKWDFQYFPYSWCNSNKYKRFLERFEFIREIVYH